MMKSILKIVLVVLCCLPATTMAQNKFSVKGTIGSFVKDSYINLSYRNAGEDIKDSVKIKNGKFSFEGKVEAPTMALLQIKNTDANSRQSDYIQFYLEPSKVTITSKDSLKHAIVSGSKSNEENVTLKKLQEPYKKSADSIVAVYYKLSPAERKDSSFIKSASKVMQETQKGYESVSRSFIGDNLNSHISLLTFREVELGHNFNPDTAANRFAKFSDAMKTSSLGKRLQETIEIGKRTNVGVFAMDFEQPDSLGNPIKLSDFRGQYVLLDFWASWCVPCRAENPVMLAAYNKFKHKNFTILGVSLDDEKSRQAWVNAVKIDGIPWPQVSELKGFKGKVAIDYGVTAIPTNFLIDPNGKIVARNLRGHDLEKTLTAIIDNQ